jgi:lipoprotein NlpD
MMFRQGCFLLATLALFVLLQSCSSNGKKWNPDDYTVKSGDTVHSIAWRYELDADDFAAWNGISTSKFIKPGQRLHTRKPANFDSQRRKQVEQSVAYAPQSAAGQEKTESNQVYKKWVKAEKGDTLYGISKRYGVSVERLAQLNQLKKPYVIKPGQTIFLKPLKTETRPTVKVAEKSKVQPVKTSPTVSSNTQSQTISWPKSVRWQRPASGKIVKKFSRWRNDAKGIDIEGKLGDTIVASADGKVVYSGNGLISYGNLIIIKHNKSFLSAYAYNRKLLVKEGDMVKAGQKIAEMGRKDKLSPRLHFEIRKNGKPVDPLKYLPW